MKKLVVWAIVLILCFSISGCGGSKEDDINSLVRTHDVKKDIIKFDDIEWLTELSEAEKKIKDDLITTNNLHISDTCHEIDDTSGYLYMRYKDEDGEDLYQNSIGKLAGWDINAVSITYIEKNGKKYVYEFFMNIIDLENGNSIEDIKNDIVEKLDIKYGEENRNTNNPKYGNEWIDKNDNRVRIGSNDECVFIDYICNDGNEYIDKKFEEKKNEMKKNIEQTKKENSKGL